MEMPVVIVPEPLAGRPPAPKNIAHKRLAGKGRAEEEAEQPRANSSSRHEIQNPASVHITDAERKKWEVPYDLLCLMTCFVYSK
ncbi:hypothetical protein SUGI_0908600 [Cryptomeria japonica]|nr:hypothetical protein SUGI_0908600 [Cryptomeria japonica]